MYTTTYCPYCIRAKMFLKRKGAAFRDIDVSGNSEKRRWLVDVTGMRTVPQIFINGKSIGGCDDMIALDRAGALDELLAEAPVAA
jgi:glutaredoxin 3